MSIKFKWSSPEAEKRAVRNVARLKCCGLHDFDWHDAVTRALARREADVERWGVIVNIRPIIWCRCKKCGGRALVEYARPYMAGVNAAQQELLK